MSDVKRAREEGGSDDGAAAAEAAAPSFASLTHDDVMLGLGIVAQTLARCTHTMAEDAAAARAASDAWAARPPRPDDDEGCLARVRRVAKLAAERAKRDAEEAPLLLIIFSARATGLCRDTWTCVPPGLSAADAARVRESHPIWRAIINLGHGCSSETRLFWAARNSTLARVRELCDWHADVDAADAAGWSTPLMEACGRGHVDIVRELLKRGADIDAANVFGETSLIYASSDGHLDVVRELLAHGADIEAATSDGETPLIAASISGRVEVVRELLAAGADKRHTDKRRRTAHKLAGSAIFVPAASRRAIRALLYAAP